MLKRAVGWGVLLLVSLGTLVAYGSATARKLPPGKDPVLVGAADIAECENPGDVATARQLDRIPGTVFTLGDNVYESVTATEFATCYDPSWGRHKMRTRPSPGTHEYATSGARGYYAYFGAAAGDASKGHYSYDLGTWHIVVINSNCVEVGGDVCISPSGN